MKGRLLSVLILTVILGMVGSGVAAAQGYAPGYMVLDRSGASVWAGPDLDEALLRLQPNYTLVFREGTHEISSLEIDERVTLEGYGKARIVLGYGEITLRAPNSTVQNLTIEGTVKVFNTMRVTIRNNILSSPGSAIVAEGDVRYLTVEKNIITGSACAIRLDATGGSIREVEIANNTIGGSGAKANLRGVQLSGTGDFYNITVKNNDFLGNTDAALYSSADCTVNASYNWWGHAQGPYLPGAGQTYGPDSSAAYQQVVGDVIVSPWYDRPVRQGAAVYGFYNETLQKYHHTLQEAVDQARSGNIVHIGPFTFSEEVTFDKDLVISGAGRAGTVFKTTGSVDAPSEFVFKVKPGCSVTLSNLTVEGLKAAQYGVLVEGGDRETQLRLQEVAIKEPVYYGVRADGERGEPVRLYLTGCRVDSGTRGLDGNPPASVFMNGRQVWGYLANNTLVKRAADALGLLNLGGRLGETVHRLAGADRYATAAAISKEGWSEAGAVVIATGADFADALAAVPLAALKNAPLLLTERNRLPAAAEAEIKRLGARTAYIIGGAGAVSTAVENDLKNLGLTITRLYGKDRYATAAAIAREIAGEVEIGGVLIATGTDFPDALAAGPLAGYCRRPILLVRRDSIPEATREFLESLPPYDLWTVGGTGAVSAGVTDELLNRAGARNHLRLSGSNRFETALAVADKLRVEYGVDRLDTVFVARGDHFADALAGGALAARSNMRGAVLLTESARLNAATKKWLAEHGSGRGYLLGGTGALSTTVENEVRGAF